MLFSDIHDFINSLKTSLNSLHVALIIVANILKYFLTASLKAVILEVYFLCIFMQFLIRKRGGSQVYIKKLTLDDELYLCRMVELLWQLSALLLLLQGASLMFR